MQGLASVAGSQVLAASGGEGRGLTAEVAVGGNGVGVGSSGASERQPDEQEGRSLERLYEAGPQAVVEAVGWAGGALSEAQEERAQSVSDVLHDNRFRSAAEANAAEGMGRRVEWECDGDNGREGFLHFERYGKGRGGGVDMWAL